MIKETGQLLKIIGIGAAFTLVYEGALWLVKKTNHKSSQQKPKHKKAIPSEISQVKSKMKSKIKKTGDKVSA